MKIIESESGFINSWNNIFNKYFNHSDIFFREEWFKTFHQNNEEVICFYYIKKDFCFIFPLIKKKINNEDLFDVESIYGYSGPLFNFPDEELIKDAFDTFYKLCAEEKIIAGFIRFNPYLKNLIEDDRLKIILDRHIVNVILTNKNEDDLFKSFHQKHRNAIRKSEKLGLKFIHDYDFVYYENFKVLYKKTMDRLEASDFYKFDDAFFDSLKNNLKDSLSIFCVSFEDEIISSCLTLKHDNRVHYFLSASNEDKWHLSPNTFLVNKTMASFINQGVTDFNLGGGREKDGDTLFKFKARFSTNALPFYIGKIVFIQNAYSRLVKDWEESSTEEKKIQYKNILLKYRY